MTFCKQNIIPVKRLRNGFKMPVYGFGTWKIGNTKSSSRDEIKILKKAIDLGVSHIDTAEQYGDGRAEVLIGEAIKDYDRSKLLITSKVLPEKLKYKDLIRSTKASLRRLKTSYLDLYLIHRANPQIPPEETAKALDFLIDEGLVRNIGVCNFTSRNISLFQSFLHHKIVVDELHYNLIHRQIEHFGLLKYCQNQDIMIIAYRPLQQGLLTAKKNSQIDNICRKYNKTLSQIAINWLISQKNVTTICKTSKLEHLKENLGAVGWIMDEEDIEILRKNFPNQKNTSSSYLEDKSKIYFKF